MKKLVLLFVALATIGALQAQGQIEAKINPLGVLFNQPTIAAEYVVSDYFGVELTTGLYYGKPFAIDGSKQSGGKIRLSGKYYFSPDDGADGWYLGFYMKNSSRKFTEMENINDYKQKDFGVGFGVGRKWVFDTGFLIESGFGLGKNISSEREWADPNGDTDNSLDMPFNGYFQLVIGYRFN